MQNKILLSALFGFATTTIGYFIFNDNDDHKKKPDIQINQYKIVNSNNANYDEVKIESVEKSNQSEKSEKSEKGKKNENS